MRPLASYAMTLLLSARRTSVIRHVPAALSHRSCGVIVQHLKLVSSRSHAQGKGGGDDRSPGTGDLGGPSNRTPSPERRRSPGARGSGRAASTPARGGGSPGRRAQDPSHPMANVPNEALPLNLIEALQNEARRPGEKQRPRRPRPPTLMFSAHVVVAMWSAGSQTAAPG